MTIHSSMAVYKLCTVNGKPCHIFIQQFSKNNEGNVPYIKEVGKIMHFSSWKILNLYNCTRYENTVVQLVHSDLISD